MSSALDGECDKATSGKSNDFGQAVSELAALAAAGEGRRGTEQGWMSGPSPEKRSSVRSLLRASVTAAKTAAGARMWGWHAAAARKRRWQKRKRQADGQYREFCSKKVLGICLEKKRSYCQFDSKLAQIVQQQGRNGQLHIGFGGASSPDCRGLRLKSSRGSTLTCLISPTLWTT